MPLRRIRGDLAAVAVALEPDGRGFGEIEIVAALPAAPGAALDVGSALVGRVEVLSAGSSAHEGYVVRLRADPRDPAAARARIPRAAAGEYEVTFEAGHRLFRIPARRVLVTVGSTASVELDLAGAAPSATGGLEVVAADPAGGSVDGPLTVDLARPDRPELALCAGMTFAQPPYRVPFVPAGAYAISVHRPDELTRWSADAPVFRVEPGRWTAANVTLPARSR